MPQNATIADQTIILGDLLERTGIVNYALTMGFPSPR